MVYSNLNTNIHYILPNELSISNNGEYDHMFVARTGNVGYIQLIFQPDVDIDIYDGDILVYIIPEGFRPLYYTKSGLVYQSVKIENQYGSITTTLIETGELYIGGYYGFDANRWIWISLAYICA